MKSRLQSLYENKIATELQKEVGILNPFAVPRLSHIVISTTLKDISDSKQLDQMAEELFLITGQKPVVTRAKKSIAAFKVREGMPMGLKVTLRKHMMYHFLDRFVNFALPRVKDFRGISSKKFDGRGNFAMGLKEHIVFPEIDYDKVQGQWGMNIVCCTTAKNDSDAKALLSKFNLPFNN